MSETKCPRCGRALNVEKGAAFCPYCGGLLAQAENQRESEAVSTLLEKVGALSDPVKKHQLLTEAQTRYPDSLAIAEELLYLGRLYERNARTLDFSVIKSYLLMIYLEPETISPEKIKAMRTELFDHPQLERCLALCEDREAFLNRYITRLASQFIDLFLRGSSRYMRRFFGFGLDSRAPKMLATPTVKMLAGMRDDAALTPEQRSLLMHGLYSSYSVQLGNDMQWLHKEMAEHGVAMP